MRVWIIGASHPILSWNDRGSYLYQGMGRRYATAVRRKYIYNNYRDMSLGRRRDSRSNRELGPDVRDDASLKYLTRTIVSLYLRMDECMHASSTGPRFFAVRGRNARWLMSEVAKTLPFPSSWSCVGFLPPVQ